MKGISSKLFGGLAIGTGLLVTMLALPVSLNAQSFYGSIVGTVTDASGAIVPGASVTLINIGTNEKHVDASDASGNFHFVNLIPAAYSVEVQKTSFKRFVRNSVVVQVDNTTRVDVALQVGAATETVEVTTQAPLLQTDSGTLGAEVEGKTVQAMPLNGRNIMNLIALVPGVQPQGSTSGAAGMNQGDRTNNSGWTNYQIGGSIAGHGTTYIDGAPDNPMAGMAAGNTQGFVPVQDAIQEFKVSTSAISPEFGRFGGGVVEMTTKSGSNAWHGTAYEYFRNTALDTNSYGWNAANATAGTTGRQKLNQNQYGGLVSGPVLKNKAFFMFSYEGFKMRSSLTDQFNIPDAGMMSDTDPSVPRALTDPGTIISNWTKQGTYGASGTDCTEAYNTRGDGRTHIDPNCVDPAAKLLKEYFPDVNQAASATNPIQYYNSSSNAGLTGQYRNFNVPYNVGADTPQYNVRGDVNISSKQRLFVRYSYFKLTDIPVDELHSSHGYLTAADTNDYITHQGVIGDTYTINPTTIADARFSVMRNYDDNMQPSAGKSSTNTFIQSLGPGWAPVLAATSQVQLPMITLGGGWSGGPDGLYAFRGMQGWGWNWNDLYALSASLTKIKGKHTLKFGGEVRFMDQTAGGQWTPDGELTYNADYAGDEWANFLLGIPDSVSMSTSKSSGAFEWYQGYYASDTWTVSRKLTVSGGLRWELPGGVAERKNSNTVLLLGTYNDIKGTEALVNSPQWGDRTNEPARHDLFSPRAGFAYRVGQNTVVRGGYSLVYLPPDWGQILPATSPVNSANTTANNTWQGSNVYYTTSAPFGSGAHAVAINMPVGTTYKGDDFLSYFQNAYSGMPISGAVPTNKLTYMQQWNLTAGQQFKGQQSIEIGYAGALGVHLLPSSTTWSLDEPNQTQIAEIKSCGWGCDISQYMPFPHYSNVSNGNDYIGTINYNSMQARYEKRFGAGASITSSYTFAKSLGDTDTIMSFLDKGQDGVAQDYNNIKGEHSILSYSIKNRWVTSYILSLPFGRGKKFASNVNGALDRAIGGWEVNGITTLQSGNHIMLADNAGDGMVYQLNAGALRPDYISGCNKMQGITGSQQQRLGGWFNTKCFAQPDVNQGNFYALGSEPRVDPSLTTSGVANWDLTAQKATKMTEKTSVEFRMEFYNLFNRRQWAMPNNDVSGWGFGTVSDQQNSPRQMQASLRVSF